MKIVSPIINFALRTYDTITMPHGMEALGQEVESRNEFNSLNSKAGTLSPKETRRLAYLHDLRNYCEELRTAIANPKYSLR